jgi:alpha-beta hydrolase superfamily lysophospholipase
MRWLKRLALVALGALGGLVAGHLWRETRGTPPALWHTWTPAGELTAERLGSGGDVRDFAAYLEAEEQLFAAVASELARHRAALPAYSRFLAGSPTHPSRFERDGNRSYQLPAAGALRGDALLLHGLSDSPYSLHAVADLLAGEGWQVTVLRLPGHGTVPGALAAVSRADWRAAVALAARDLPTHRPVATDRSHAAPTNPAGRPFLLVGYSNGAALALDYTLDALATAGDTTAERQLPLPDRLVFLSPAFAVSPAAALAGWQAALARLPSLARLAWSPLEEELDPFKYSSFPVLAGAEIHALTSELEEKLEQLAVRGDPLPPMLVLQSVVDATIPPVPSLTRVLSRLGKSAGASELVLFDANRHATIAPLLSRHVDELLALATPGRRFPFAITLVTNREPDSAAVHALRRGPDQLETTSEPLPLAWPSGVHSLSHVAIPFPPDDPVYGAASSAAGPPFPFGALEVKGERDAFRVPPGMLARLRYNPFFAVVTAKIRSFLAPPPPPQPAVAPAPG